MNITARLQELNPDLILHNEGDWQNPLDPTKSGFTSFNDAGIETETGEFLYSMVRILKPKWVLETGTHWGVGAAYMGQALKDNQLGMIDTVEFLPEIAHKALENFKALQLTGYINSYIKDVKDFDPHFGVEEPKTYQLILIDTEPQTRFAEVLKFWDYLDEGGFLFIHDLHRHMHQIENEEHGFAWPFGKLPKALVDLVKSGKARPFHFSTPRGLTGFYKVSKDDYNWGS